MTSMAVALDRNLVLACYSSLSYDGYSKIMDTLNLQATKLFIVTPATKGGVVTTPLRFRVRFKILYRVIHPFIQHFFLRKMVYLNIIYVIATRNYEFFYYRHCSFCVTQQ